MSPKRSLVFAVVGLFGSVYLSHPPTSLAQTARIEIHSIETLTLTDQQFLAGDKNGKPAIIGGELRLPPGAGRFPAVILAHGSSGVGGREDYWSEALNGIGIATFVLDSFTGRGIVEMQTDQSQMGSLSIIGDAYRVLAILSKHSRIDPSRIALMGFSKGGYVTLYASLKRFQRMYAPPGVEFSAYIPFYATCFTTYIDEDQVTDRPIRMFHGTADDYVPASSCRPYFQRLRELGKDIQRTEYPGAHHAFDNPLLPPVRKLPEAQIRSRRCLAEERPGGQVVNRKTGQPFTFSDPCIERGATVGYDPKATAEATKAVKEFLASLWKLNSTAQVGQVANQAVSQAAPQDDVAKQFVGMWRLVSWSQRLADGSTRQEPRSVSHIIYSDTRHMCWVAMDPNRPRWDSATVPTESEAASGLRGFGAYCASVEVHASEGFLLHRVEIEKSPNFVGTTRKRWFAFQSPNRLTLRIDAAELTFPVVESTLTWERVEK